MNGVEWYYAVGDTQYGPVSQSTLQTLLQTGQVGSDDLVWKEGMAQWAEARTVRDLSVPAAAGMGAPPPVPSGMGRGLGVNRDSLRSEAAQRRVQKRPLLATMAFLTAILAGGLSLLLAYGHLEGAEELVMTANEYEYPEIIRDLASEWRIGGYVAAALGALSLLGGTMVFVGAAGCRLVLGVTCLAMTGFCIYIIRENMAINEELDIESTPTEHLIQWFLLAAAITPLLCVMPSEVTKWLEVKQGRARPTRRGGSMATAGARRPAGRSRRGRSRR